MSSKEPRIFVNIASYRDSECQWTVRDLFDKADRPDDISVGICWQFDPEHDQDCFTIETRPDQVRRIDFHPKESRGVCWARNQVQKLWAGEEFTLQIDSHMRFVPGWDTILLEMYQACPTDKAVLSTYPTGYEPPDTLLPVTIATIRPREFDGRGMFKVRSETCPPDTAPATPSPTAFVAAGFLFAPALIIEDVPYDPYIYFQGEEITLAVRLWTYGWDLFTPNRHVIYHDYTQGRGRSRHWEDDTDWTALNRGSEYRVRHLLGSPNPDWDAVKVEEALREIDEFDLGDVRSLADYQAFSGVNFNTSEIVEGAGPTGPPAPEPPAPDPTEPSRTGTEEQHNRARIFTSIWTGRDWANSETVSGGGATMAETAVIRRRLPEIFQELGIQVLADAGCGDLNWMAEISSDLRLYLGFDIVSGLMEDLRATHAARKNHFFSTADIVSDTLPACDAILCRDCLTHMTTAEARAALRRMKQSGSTFLITTSHLHSQNREINQGAWYPICLTADPFGLPDPLLVIEEGFGGSTKALCVWRLADLPD